MSVTTRPHLEKRGAFRYYRLSYCSSLSVNPGTSLKSAARFVEIINIQNNYFRTGLLLLTKTSTVQKRCGMKKDIHPQYYPNAKVTCACGNTFKVGATKEAIEVEICSACHPFYIGGGRGSLHGSRVERFQKQMARHQELKGKKGKDETGNATQKSAN